VLSFLKTPPDILRKMHADAATVLAEPAIRSKFEPLGVDVRNYRRGSFIAVPPSAAASFDHPVGAGEQRGRDGETKGLRGLP
jgi:hypothetical protein